MTKRKRNSNSSDDNQQTRDLVLIDADGRAVKAHRALLIDRSDYFAKILEDNKELREVQLNERYLIELIHYLYNHENLSPTSDSSSLLDNQSCHWSTSRDEPQDNFLDSASSIVHGDLEIVMQLLALCKKYGFKQLQRRLVSEIYYRLGSTTVVPIYRYACELDLTDIQNYALIMILSWLPNLERTQEFLSLPEECIHQIFGAEELEVESESKLNALSAWWSHNKDADMTNLWVQLITCTYKYDE